MTTKDVPQSQQQLLLLSAAEEAYCAAASVLIIGLRQMKEEHEIQDGTPMDAGLHLLEEAMAAHNRYAESLK